MMEILDKEISVLAALKELGRNYRISPDWNVVEAHVYDKTPDGTPVLGLPQRPVWRVDLVEGKVEYLAPAFMDYKDRDAIRALLAISQLERSGLA